VPYVYAYAVVNGDSIRSGLVDVLISSGFADPARFSVSATTLNFPGMQFDGLTDGIRVQPGDRFGNPVPPNTPVWFYTTHGVVQTENAYTDINGIINQNLYSNGQRPLLDATGNHRVPGMTDGFTFVKARTMGEAGQDIWDSVRVLWTGAPMTPFNDASLWVGVPAVDQPPHFWTVVGPANFAIPNGGGAGPWQFQIRDFWGNPLSAGTTITVTCELAKISTDADVKLPDTQAGANGTTANGITDFTVVIQDADNKDTDPPAATLLIVKVSHPIYGEISFVLASGTID
jgi:hypothetical protein